jgi:hypothetical protein
MKEGENPLDDGSRCNSKVARFNSNKEDIFF